MNSEFANNVRFGDIKQLQNWKGSPLLQYWGECKVMQTFTEGLDNTHVLNFSVFLFHHSFLTLPILFNTGSFVFLLTQLWFSQPTTAITLPERTSLLLEMTVNVDLRCLSCSSILSCCQMYLPQNNFPNVALSFRSSPIPLFPWWKLKFLPIASVLKALYKRDKMEMISRSISHSI